MILNNKIKQILVTKSLTPSLFADKIGVQRSSISHILSGRNKPSFEIIQKIVKCYPDLGFDWLMDDSKTELNSSISDEYSSRKVADSNVNMVNNSITNNANLNSFINMDGKKVNKIVVFFADNSFAEYTPAL